MEDRRPKLVSWQDDFLIPPYSKWHQRKPSLPREERLNQTFISIVSNQPNPVQIPKKSTLVFENDWSFELCEFCTDVKTCCYACWCPLCFSISLFTDAREFCLTAFVPGSLGHLRAKIRSAYKINGKIEDDACIGLCCACCSMIQLKRELVEKGEIKD